jgi:hypothetical protein
MVVSNLTNRVAIYVSFNRNMQRLGELLMLIPGAKVPGEAVFTMIRLRRSLFVVCAACTS